MKKRLHRTLACTLFLLVATLNLIAQTADKGGVSGRIVDNSYQPYFPVAVAVEGELLGGYTNERGEYRIEQIPAGSRTLLISGLGVKSKRVSIKVVAGRISSLSDIVIEENSELISEVEVIGKSEARRQQEQAYAISVLDIKRSYIQAAPLNRLLNNISSVRVREEGGMGSNYNFSLNGFSGNQVKFFLDGIPMDNFGSSFNLGNISANMAERIEVYKGVLPVSLGGDALGGAVNIVSRKDANYIDASYSVGSFNTHKVSLNGAYTDAKSGFTFRANAFYNFSDNDYKVLVPIIDLETNKKEEERWVRRFNDGYWAAGARIEAGITNKPYADYLLFGLIASKNDNNLQTGATMDAVYGGVTQQSESLIPSIRYKKEDLFVDGLSLSLYGTYGIVNSYNTDTLARRYNWLGQYVPTTSAGEGFLTDSRIANREWQGNANLNYVINSHQSVTLNHVISSMERTINDKAKPDDAMNNIPQNLTKNITGLGWQIRYSRWNANVFTKLYHLNSSTYKRLDEFTENARWEKVNDTKLNVGYGAAFTYHILPSLQAKLSYEQAYRLPDALEMFGDGLIQQRNPDLKPESSRNLNLGLSYDQRFGMHRISSEANLIYRNTQDFILKGVSLTSNPTTGFDNLGKVLTDGVEASARYHFKDLLHVGANITYQQIVDNQEFEKNEGSFVGDGITENITYKERLPNIPYLFANADMGLRFKNVGFKGTQLSFDYNLAYVHRYFLSFPGLGSAASKKVIPQQLSHDISVGYTLADGRYSVLVECSNLTNALLYDNYRLQKPGRAFNVKFRYFFSK